MEYHIFLTFCLLLICSFIDRTFQFNLETRLPVIKNGPADSYFGFSVAEHITHTRKSVAEELLLVGAPIFQDEELPFNKSGGVFQCPLSSYFDDCMKLPLENVTTENTEDKNGEWLGVSVTSQGRGGIVSACAHRYKKVFLTDDVIRGISPLGKCFFLTSTLEKADGFERIPCLSQSPGHSNFGYCQAGTGAAIGEDAHTMIGTPGAVHWRGSMIVYNDMHGAFWAPEDELDANIPKNSYFGFSAASGQFASGKTFFLGGAPRANAKGAVGIFEKRTFSIAFVDMIVSDAPYSSFGYSVATGDLNGDGFDDIIVGAPMYYNRTTLVGGAVYVFINNAKNGMFSDVEPVIITGPLDSRFGMAITSMGDTNFDGYEDFAVGAPYDNDGQGSVYVYLGSADGVVQPYTQKITPSDFPTQLQGAILPNETFGYSISGGQDLDYNGFPDLLVGAFESESVILLRARPVINLTATVEVTPDALQPETPNCDVNGEMKLCFEISVCAQYFTDSPYDEELEIMFEVMAESKRLSLGLNSRVYFEGAEPDHILANQTLMLNYKSDETLSCAAPIQAILRDDFSDIYRSIPLKVTFSMPNSDVTIPQPGEPLPDMGPTVMFDHSSITTLATECEEDLESPSSCTAIPEVKVEFTKECAKDDGVCISDLVVIADVDNLVDRSDGGNPLLKVGIDTGVDIAVEIENRDEEAYDAQLIVEYSKHLTYAGLAEGATERVRYSCEEPMDKEDGNDTMVLVCKLGNPYPKAITKDSMVMKFDAAAVPPDAGSLTFHIFAHSTNDDSNEADNSIMITVDVESVTDIQLDGLVARSQYFYGGIIRGESAIGSEEQIGPLVQQTWTVFNEGPATVDELTVTINFPYEVANGKWLLYMLQKPVITAGNGSCTVEEMYINTAGIEPCPNCSRRSSSKKKNTYDPSDYLSPDQVEPTDQQVLDCADGTAHCFPIICVFRDLSGEQNKNEAVIEISARLWNATFMEDYLQARNIRIRIHGSVEMANSSVVTQTTTTNDRDTTNFDVVSPNLTIHTQGVAWWIILIAILLGLLLLILLIVLLWKCGFFRRPFASGGSGGPCGFFERKTGYQYSSVTKKQSEATVGTEKRQMYDEMYNYSAVPSSDVPNSPHQL